MKTLTKLFIVTLLLSATFLQAQTTWRAVYQFKEIQTEADKKKQDSLIKARPELAAVYKQIRERFSNLTYYLDFNKNESVFKEQEKLENQKFGAGNVVIEIGNNEEILYKNNQDKEYIRTSSMFDGAYRIVDSLPNYQWKVSKETKLIGKYLVIKAVGVEEIKDKKGKITKQEIIAWFTPQIPVGTGPELYGGLPGLIMEIKIDNEIYLVKEVIVNPKKHNKIIKPEKGKAINSNDFAKKQKAYIEKMKKMYKNNRSKKGSNTNTFTF
jgi:GLPGLI family protein